VRPASVGRRPRREWDREAPAECEVARVPLGGSSVDAFTLFLERCEVILDGISVTQYQEVPNMLLEVCLRAPKGAPLGAQDILWRMAVATHLARGEASGIDGSRGGGGGGPGAGPGPSGGSAPSRGVVVAGVGVPGVPGRDPTVLLRVMPLARFPPPPS